MKSKMAEILKHNGKPAKKVVELLAKRGITVSVAYVYGTRFRAAHVEQSQLRLVLNDASRVKLESLSNQTNLSMNEVIRQLITRAKAKDLKS